MQQLGAVALAAAVEEDDVPREVVGSADFAGAVEDGADGGEGLVIGEVPAAAHDALLEKPGARTGKFHVVVVVGFDGEEVDAAEFFDEGVGHMPKIGRESSAGAGGFDDKAVGTSGVMGEGQNFKADAADGFEGVIKRRDERFEGVRREPALFKRGSEVADFGSFEKSPEMAARNVQADLMFEESEQPVKIKVVGIKVSEDDGGEILEPQANAVQALLGHARAEAGINEEGAPGGAHDGGIAPRSTA